MAKIGSTDLALVTSRVGCCRLGASRLGFTPYDVKGPGATYPCEYMWREVKPPTTQWTLQTEGVVCGKRPVAAFTMTGVSVPPPPTTGSVSGVIYHPAVAPGNEVVGATVQIVAQGLSTVSAADGSYSFPVVNAGAIQVFADASNQWNPGIGVTISAAVAGVNVVVNVVVAGGPI